MCILFKKGIIISHRGTEIRRIKQKSKRLNLDTDKHRNVIPSVARNLCFEILRASPSE